ncbi:MAG: ATP-binding cassette domain-containing protein, partial [Verrucomicrobia bacterium]|nr:ATP-binding cassette domain-containing protein [Cytophagales bacterium]
MNQNVLQAIFKLLITSVKIDGLVQGERVVVEKFLHENLKDADVRRYMKEFDRLVEKNVYDEKLALSTSIEINRELNRTQKIIVLMHLIELGFSDDDFSVREEKFASQVAEQFNIEHAIFEALENFIITKNIYDLSSFRVLVIDNKPHPEEPQFKHFQKPNLSTPIAVLRLPVDEMYFLRIGFPNEEITLNGKTISPDYVYPLVQGSVIRSEKAEPIYFSTIVNYFFQSDDKPKISFEAKHINFFFQKGKQGLHNINIAEEGGKLIALMGASGSGKSTLLNVLNGNKEPQQGKVLINGL